MNRKSFTRIPNFYFAFRVPHFALRLDPSSLIPRPQPADYDGDRKADFTVYRNGTWYIHNSGTDTSKVVNWGLAGDQPISSAYRIQKIRVG